MGKSPISMAMFNNYVGLPVDNSSWEQLRGYQKKNACPNSQSWEKDWIVIGHNHHELLMIWISRHDHGEKS